ncbi:MAG: T9SS type A sorting domain-containing protein [Saprospiraceae bacterium]
MNIIRIYPMLVLLCLFISAQNTHAQCNLILSADVTHINCFGDQGTIDLTVGNGVLPYTYIWSNGETTEDLNGLPLGLYIVTVVDALGCNANLARSIDGPSEPLNLVINTSGVISCLDPYVEVTSDVSGGTPPYDLIWSNGQTDNYVGDFDGATYSLTITDAHGCTISASKTVGTSPTYPIADGGPLNVFVSCATAPNMLGGPGTSMGANFLYEWTTFNGVIDPGVDIHQPFIEVTEFGTYFLTVTSIAEGCTREDLVIVSGAVGFPNVNIQVPPSLDCQTTQVTLNATGSSTGPQYSYLWTTDNGHIVSGASTLTPVVDAAGSYILAITNTQEGCTKKRQVNVLGDQSTPIANAGPDTGIPCGGNPVTLDGTNSSIGPQYTHLWTTADGNILAGANTMNPIVNLPGTYTLLVTNTQTGCTQTDNVKVFPGPVIPLADFSLLDVSCTGQLGIAGVNMTQGSGPYTYLWSNGSTEATIVNIFQGTYSVVVTDATGCDYYGEVEIKDTSTLTLSAQTTAPSCIPGNDGAIDLTATSAFGPFEYAWASGETTQDLSNLPAGTYTVTVTYAGATCTQTLSVALVNSFGMTLSTIVTNAACNGGCTGLIDLTVTGGATPYVYIWNMGNTTQDVQNLCANTYTVTVTDSNNCTETTNATVGLAIELNLSAVVTSSTSCSFPNGSIDLSVTPSGNFTYNWSDGTTNEDKPNLQAGTYSVTVSAGGLCTAVETFTVPFVPNFPIPTAIPTATTCDFSNGSIDASVTGGVGPYNYQWSNGVVTQDLSNIVSGLYWLTVTGANGCTNTISVNLGNSNPSITINGMVSPNSVCIGNPNGSIDVTVLPSGSYSYTWSNGATTGDLSSLLPATYTITVSAGGSCTNTAGFIVPDNSNAPLITSTTTDASCNGSDGAIDLTVIGGTPNYTYEWSNGSLTEDLASIPAGNYMVTVTDAAGCAKLATIAVGNISDLAIFSMVTNVLCSGGSDGSVDLTVTGGTPGYTFLWSNGAATEDISGLVAGTYTVTVTDLNSCTKTGSATILQPTALNLSATNINVLCFGGNNGAINLTVTGASPVYTYLWSNSSTAQDLSGLTAGTYTVTVTDNNACTKTTSSTISQPPQLILTATVNTVSCFGGNNGAIDLTISGGVAPYVYAWTNTATTQDLSNLISGIYTVTVTDANSCTRSSIYTVNQPTQQLTFSIVSLSNTCSSEVITGPNLPNFTYQWTGPNGFTSTTAAITTNFSGVYSLTITDPNGCTASNNYTVNLSGGSACGAINGRVYHDEDESCSLNAGEPDLAGWIVRAEGLNDTLYGVTNVQGQYLVGVPVGTYDIKVFVPNGLWTICPGGIMATVGMAGDTVSGGDFPVQSTYICPALTVSLGTNQLRRCFSNNFYELEYCNQGTQAAQDAFITVALDPFLTPMSSSIPYTDQGANVLRFELGDIAIGECGVFNIQVFVNCNAVLGQTHCTQASIFPDTLCAPTNTNWSGASLSIQSTCSNDSLRFIIRNDGKAAMSTTREYIVVEDGIMFRSGILPPLVENDSMIIAVEANGSTWRVEVDQEAFHPYALPVGLSVEGCASASFSTGFVNQFTTPDEPPTTDIDCTTNIGSFDPNDKHGYPVGYGADHYIRPGTDIEYLVRFQNTGTDTAFTVQIIDTLSLWLDPATIRFGASSHPYRYDLTGDGVVHFIFENILLPDSFTNEVASNGFAKFTIKPRLEAPLETLIENTAAIYFDFNDPVFTNTTFHRLGENFITVGLWQPFVPEARVTAVPNPFNEQTILEVKGLLRSGGLRLQVFDLQGKVVRETESENVFFHLRKGDWPSGIYLFKITQNGQLVGNGKLIAE